MGLLVEGVWRDDSHDTARMKDGRFNRPTTKFRNWSRPDGSPGLRAMAGLPLNPAAIISTSRSPARGRTAPSSSASSSGWRT